MNARRVRTARFACTALSIVLIAGAGWASSASIGVAAGIWSAPGGVSSGLELWLDASEPATASVAPRIRWWFDKSNAERDAREIPMTNLPALGNSGGYSEATFTSSALALASGVPSEPLTLAVVVRLSSATGTYSILGSRSRATGIVISAAKVRFYVNDVYTTTGTISPSTGRIILLVRTTSGGTDYVSVNGGAELSVSFTAADPLDTLGGVLLAESLRTFTGGISEIAAWDRVLSAAERTAVTRALGAKWGVSVP